MEIKCIACERLLASHGYDGQSLATAMATQDGQAEIVKAPLPSPPAAGSEQEELPAEPEKAKRRKSIEVVDLQTWVAENFPDLRLLQAGDYGKKVPALCEVCVRPRYPNGKVLELASTKENQMRHFLSRHVSSPGHQRALRLRDGCLLQEVSRPELQQQEHECQGVCIDGNSRAQLQMFPEEFNHWATFCRVSAVTKHTYWQDCGGLIGILMHFVGFGLALCILLSP